MASNETLNNDIIICESPIVISLYSSKQTVHLSLGSADLLNYKPEVLARIWPTFLHTFRLFRVKVDFCKYLVN